MTARLWGLLFFAIFVGAVVLTRGILLPFLLGLAIAYLLDPAADWLENRKIDRGLASGIVIILFFLFAAGVIVAFVPILQGQLVQAAKAIPAAIARLRPTIETLLAEHETLLSTFLGSDLASVLASAGQQALASLKTFVTQILSSSLALFNLLSLILISPVVAFYLLRDWDVMIAQLNDWLPPAYASDIREQTQKVDAVLSSFVRGQMFICFIMGALYAIGWSFVGLDFGLILGLLAGLMAFIPFVGVFFALFVALVVALGQWGLDWTNIVLVVGVFGAVQTLEGVFLTPRLMGDRVGLHPVWVLFAVFAGGEVMGFVGILIAVPAAASIAVLVRYVLERYVKHYGLDEAEPSKKKTGAS